MIGITRNTILENSTIKDKVEAGLKNPVSITLFRSMLISLVLAHFFLIGLKQLPENPISHQYKYELQGYMDPFFSQAWTLFAPNPINSNLSLLYQFQYETLTTRYDSSEWIDVSAPIIEERKVNFFSPAQRINKFTTSSMEDINGTYRVAHDYIEKNDSLKNNLSEVESFIENTINASHGHQSILLYANHVARRYFADHRLEIPKKLNVRYKILNAKFPRFSKRDLDYYDLENYELTQVTSKFYPLNLPAKNEY